MIEIVPAKESDRDFYILTHHASYRPVIESMFGWDKTRQDEFANHEFDTRNPHIVFHRNDRCGVLGWCDEGEAIRFGPLFILPEFQGRGIGSFLIDIFVEKAKEESKRLYLQTLQRNLRAKKLYESKGFVVTSSSDIYWHLQIDFR